MIGKKIAAMAMSAVLVVSLSPGLALANTLEAGQAQTKAPKTVSTQAAKKTVYVLDWYDYNSNGLLKSYAGYDIKYKGINMKSATETYTTGGYYDDDDNYVPGTKKVTYKYTMKSSNGRVKSATYKSSTSKITSKYNYSYNGSGNLVSEKYTYKVPHLYGAKSKKVKTYYTSTTNYTLKKGRPVSAQTTTKNADGSKSVGVKTKYAYDGKGNLKRWSSAQIHKLQLRVQSSETLPQKITNDV